MGPVRGTFELDKYPKGTLVYDAYHTPQEWTERGEVVGSCPGAVLLEFPLYLGPGKYNRDTHPTRCIMSTSLVSKYPIPTNGFYLRNPDDGTTPQHDCHRS